MPESCQRGEAALTRNEASDPQSIAAIRASLDARGKEANQRNFSEAIERTLIWQIVALGGVFALTFLLPPRPRSKAELANGSRRRQAFRSRASPRAVYWWISRSKVQSSRRKLVATFPTLRWITMVWLPARIASPIHKRARFRSGPR